MQRVQLFTLSGHYVATVDIRMEADGRWPRVVAFRGQHYAMHDGRYVRTSYVYEAEAVETEGVSGSV